MCTRAHLPQVPPLNQSCWLQSCGMQELLPRVGCKWCLQGPLLWPITIPARRLLMAADCHDNSTYVYILPLAELHLIVAICVTKLKLHVPHVRYCRVHPAVHQLNTFTPDVCKGVHLTFKEFLRRQSAEMLPIIRCLTLLPDTC